MLAALLSVQKFLQPLSTPENAFSPLEHPKIHAVPLSTFENFGPEIARILT